MMDWQGSSESVLRS